MTMKSAKSLVMKNKLWLFPLFLILFHKPATAGVASAMTADDLMEKMSLRRWNG